MKRTRLRKVAKRRSGLSKAEHEALKDLHREVVMLRAGASAVWETPDGKKKSKPSWYGPCEHCRKNRWLFVCHIETQGRARHMKYDSDNAFAGCFYCHIRWWHVVPQFKDPEGRLPEEWIASLVGREKREELKRRANQESRGDLRLIRLSLESERKTLLRR